MHKNIAHPAVVKAIPNTKVYINNLRESKNKTVLIS